MQPFLDEYRSRASRRESSSTLPGSTPKGQIERPPVRKERTNAGKQLPPILGAADPRHAIALTPRTGWRIPPTCADYRLPCGICPSLCGGFRPVLQEAPPDARIAFERGIGRTTPSNIRADKITRPGVRTPIHAKSRRAGSGHGRPALRPPWQPLGPPPQRTEPASRPIARRS